MQTSIDQLPARIVSQYNEIGHVSDQATRSMTYKIDAIGVTVLVKMDGKRIPAVGPQPASSGRKGVKLTAEVTISPENDAVKEAVNKAFNEQITWQPMGSIHAFPRFDTVTFIQGVNKIS